MNSFPKLKSNDNEIHIGRSNNTIEPQLKVNSDGVLVNNNNEWLDFFVKLIDSHELITFYTYII